MPPAHRHEPGCRAAEPHHEPSSVRSALPERRHDLSPSRSALRGASAAHDEAEGLRTDAYAMFLRSDVDLDAVCRAAELMHLGAVARNYEDGGYRLAWPSGLSNLVAMRGAEQARAVRATVGQLLERAPAVHAAHGARLLELATLTEQRETAWRDAETAAAQAFASERIARTVLIEQLRKNEGALRELFPGDKRMVRSFFRDGGRRRAKVAKDAPAVG
jgi:hypothetical protein